MRKVTVFFLVGVVALGAFGTYLFGRYEAGKTRLPGSTGDRGISLPGARLPSSMKGGKQSMEINVEKPKGGGVVNASINFGAGNLSIKTDEQNTLISGKASYEDQSLQPSVAVSGNDVELRVGRTTGNLPVPVRFNSKNSWDLSLAKSVPMSLDLVVGAADSDIDIGGLDLRDLSIKQGASNFRFDVSEPLAGKMDTLSFEGGASDSRFTSLGNTGAKTMEFKMGAGNFDLDFSGELVRAASVKIEGGLGKITVRIPEGRQATLVSKSGLTKVDHQGNWKQNGDEYSMAGEGEPLTIELNMAMGEVDLRN
jgi:hypothetical protein